MVSPSLMSGVSQEFVAKLQTSGMENPYLHGNLKIITCTETDLKLRVTMATLSKVAARTSCFSVQVMADGIHQSQSALKVGEDHSNTLTWQLLISGCKGLGRSVQRSRLLTAAENARRGLRRWQQQDRLQRTPRSSSPVSTWRRGAAKYPNGSLRCLGIPVGKVRVFCRELSWCLGRWDGKRGCW